MGKRNVYVWGLLAVGGLAVGAGLSMLSGRGPYDAEEVRGTLFEANPGLKKVLDFYEGDSLKHAAALYLIDNLGYHEGVDSADLRGLYRAYELFATGRYSYEQAMDSAARAYGTAGARDVRMKKDVYIDPPRWRRAARFTFACPPGWTGSPWPASLTTGVRPVSPTAMAARCIAWPRMTRGIVACRPCPTPSAWTVRRARWRSARPRAGGATWCC